MLVLDDAVDALARFLVGEGEADGYAFTHQRLAQHFFDRLAEREREYSTSDSWPGGSGQSMGLDPTPFSLLRLGGRKSPANSQRHFCIPVILSLNPEGAPHAH